MSTAKKFLIPTAIAALTLGVSSLPGALAQDDPESVAVETKADDAQKDEKAEKKRRSRCAWRRSINGFSVIDRKHLILSAGTRDFLVTVSPGCQHLNFKSAIAIKSTPAAGACVEKGDRIILDHGFSCFISQIEWVENREEAKKLVAQRNEAEEENKEDNKKDQDG